MAFDINAALSLPPTVWGYFEWFTGIVRINMDTDDFGKGKLSEEKCGFDETYNHEFFHCCQICTTGYLHYYVAHFLKEITPVWGRITEAAVQADRSMLSMLEEVLKEKQELTDKMKELLSGLDEIGESHCITPRTIIESQAFFVQKQMGNRSLTHQQFIELLKQAPAEEYSDAYLMATDYLGSNAFGYFNAIAYSALLFLEPQNVFEKICYRLSGNSFVEKDFTAKLANVVNILAENYFFLGDSEDITNQYILNREINPFYKPVIQILRSLCKEREMNFLSLMSNPAAWLGETIPQFNLPVIFNDGPEHGYSAEKTWSLFDKTYSKGLHLVLGTICLMINNQRQDFAPRYLHLRK